MRNELIGLIAGSSGDMLTKELHRAGYKVAMVCGKAGESGSEDADALLINDLSDEKTIFDFFSKNNVNVFILGTGHITAIKLSESLIGRGMTCNLDINSVILCKNKYKTNEKLRVEGIRVPKNILLNKGRFDSEVLSSYLKKLGVPCVVKSIKDFHQPQLLKTENDILQKIKKLFEKEDEVMLEEYIEGSDCTIPVINTNGSVESLKLIYWSKGQAYELDGFENSTSYKIPSKIEEEVMKMAADSVKLLNVQGLSRVDIIIDKNNVPYVLEINGVIISGIKNLITAGVFASVQINRSKLIINHALEVFNLKNYRVEEGLMFCDSQQNISNEELNSVNINNIKKGLNKHIDKYTENYLNSYLKERKIELGAEDVDKILDLHAFILLGNFDFIINNLAGKNKILLEYITELYGIKVKSMC